LIRPIIYRKEEGSVGEKIVEMVANRLERVDSSLIIKQDSEDVISIVTTNVKNPIKFKEYIIQKINSL
jgi:hypothetical protein